MNQDVVQTDKSFDVIKKVYHTLNQNTSLGIFIINREGRITYVNPTCCELSGLSLKETLGTKWHKAIYEEDKDWLCYKLEQDFRSRKVSQAEFRFFKSNGEIIWIKAESIPIWNSIKQFEGYLGILIDITKSKFNENQLQQWKKEANNSNQLKNEFISQLSHEIRTPINTIVLGLNILEEGLNIEKNFEFQDAILSLKKAGYRIIKTIESLLRLAELNTNNFSPKIIDFNLFKDVFHDIYNKYIQRVNERGLEFYLYTESSNLNVQADVDNVKQIFSHLIENAIKYTTTGSIEIKATEKYNKPVVTVSDTGIGISEDFLPFIYDPFRQEEQGYSRSYEGIGLGLTLVKKYCELNNISIGVESQKNKGTKFTLIFNQELK